MEKKHRLTVRLTDADMRMIDEMCYELGMSPSEIIRKTIENYYQYFEMTH